MQFLMFLCPVLQYVVLIEVYEENLTLYKRKVGKKEEYFNSL